MTNAQTVKAGTVESQFLLEVNGFYLYKSVTGYDLKTDVIDYTIGDNKGNEYGRFANLESAVRGFNEVLAYYSSK